MKGALLRRALVTAIAVMFAIPLSQGTAAGENWLRATTLTAPGSTSLGNDSAISSDGTRIVVGGKSDGISFSNDGAAYVYRSSGTSWVLEQRLTASDSTTNGYFGSSVDISADGSTIVIGASGVMQAYIFSRSGTTWTQQAIIDTGSTFSTSYNQFKVTVDDVGSRIAIAEVLEKRASVYHLVDGTWTQELNFVGPNWYGSSIALSGNGSTLAVGNYFAEVDAMNRRGKVDIFSRSGSAWSLSKA